jgi:uncharacterized membrane protein
MRLFGHPIHPMLVHFPIVLWTIATIAYAANAAGVIEPAGEIAKLANGAGLIMALLAMLAGALELRTIESRSETMRVASWHMMMMGTVWFCFLVALLVGKDHSVVAAVCAAAGFLLMTVGAWFGGRLVYDFGVAVKSPSKPHFDSLSEANINDHRANAID